MKLTGYLIGNERVIPAETIWETLTPPERSRAFRMLKNGELQAEGRPATQEHYHPLSPGLGNIVQIPRDAWIDATDLGWIEKHASGRRLQLTNSDHGGIYVEIGFLNTSELRQLVNFERNIETVEDFDEKLFRIMGTKMGAKVWAAAAAALASSNVSPTVPAVTSYLMERSDLWPNGTLDKRNIEKHVTPFVNEFNRLN